MNRRIVRRDVPAPVDHPSPLLARVFAARGIDDAGQLDCSLQGLLPPDSLKNIERAATLLADAIRHDKSIVIVGDFDADGATGTALLVAVLKAMKAARVGYLVPDRFRFGYGLTPAIVDEAVQLSPDLLVTVDNGIASTAGVARAAELGMEVIITDHHLPGAELPEAAAIVNPNQPGCEFPSKALAGVGVAFYLLSVVRRILLQSGWLADADAPKLADYLDLVALGTVADVVPLDQNNRRLVDAGIRRIRAGRCQPGVSALLRVAGVDPRFTTTRDLAFSLAPRLNAAGRLDDMAVGINCLLATRGNADDLAGQLDSLNAERKSIESDMREEALSLLASMTATGDELSGLCLFDPTWHQGIVGIIASRVREKTERPVIAFARAGGDDERELKGSGRSVAGFHLRDALDAIATRHPGLLSRFGGHAMAAGLSLDEADLAAFTDAFEDEVGRVLGHAAPEQVVVTDGSIGDELGLDTARLIETAAPWGQGFPEPAFDDEFEIIEQRIVGGRHLRLTLQPSSAQGAPVEAIHFNHGSMLLDAHRIHCAYRLEINRYRGREKPQLVILLIQ